MKYLGKFICIGLNPSFDLTLSVDELSDDAVNRATSEYREAAGVATNIARDLTRLRLPASVVGIAGENNLREYMGELCRENIPSHFIKVPGNIRENITLLVGERDVKTIKINRAGPKCTASALAELRGYFRGSDPTMPAFGPEIGCFAVWTLFGAMIAVTGEAISIALYLFLAQAMPCTLLMRLLGTVPGLAAGILFNLVLFTYVLKYFHALHCILLFAGN